MDTRNSNRVWSHLDSSNADEKKSEGRIFCVKCGRQAYGDGQNYQCIVSHWMKAAGPITEKPTAPTTWKEAKIKDPAIEFTVQENQVFCLKCSRAMAIVNNMCYDNKFYQLVYACKCGYTMDYHGQ